MPLKVGSQFPKSKLIGFACVSYLAITSVLIIEYVMGFLDKSIGMFDESLFLILAKNANPNVSYAGAWSGYTHLLYEIVNGDVVKFRVLGFIIVYLLGCLLGWVTLLANQNYGNIDFSWRLSISLSFGLSSLFFYSIFMFFSPGYQWLTFCGLMILGIGFFIQKVPQNGFFVAGWFVLAYCQFSFLSSVRLGRIDLSL